MPRGLPEHLSSRIVASRTSPFAASHSIIKPSKPWVVDLRCGSLSNTASPWACRAAIHETASNKKPSLRHRDAFSFSSFEPEICSCLLADDLTTLFVMTGDSTLSSRMILAACTAWPSAMIAMRRASRSISCVCQRSPMHASSISTASIFRAPADVFTKRRSPFVGPVNSEPSLSISCMEWSRVPPCANRKQIFRPLLARPTIHHTRR